MQYLEARRLQRTVVMELLDLLGHGAPQPHLGSHNGSSLGRRLLGGIEHGVLQEAHVKGEDLLQVGTDLLLLLRLSTLVERLEDGDEAGRRDGSEETSRVRGSCRAAGKPGRLRNGVETRLHGQSGTEGRELRDEDTRNWMDHGGRVLRRDNKDAGEFLYRSSWLFVMDFFRRCGRTTGTVDDAHYGDEPKQEIRRDNDLQEAYKFRCHGGFDAGFCVGANFILDSAPSTSHGEEQGQTQDTVR